MPAQREPEMEAMNSSSESAFEETVVLDADALAGAIQRLAREIVAANEDMDSVALLGILKRGRPLADRIAALMEEMTGTRPKVGSLSTQLYRDDFRTGRGGGITGGTGTHFDFDVDGLTIVLVDDVLSTGRTVRAALDELMDYGRPKRIQLACLVDRGLRELPIQADFLGWSLATSERDHVQVLLQEADGQDAVILERAGKSDEGGE